VRTRDLLHALGIDVHAWPELHGWLPGRADDTLAATGSAPDLRWRPA